MCPGAEAGISNFFKRKQDNNIGSTIVPFGIQGGVGGWERVLKEILNDAPLIRALSLYYFILIFWPSRFLHTYIVHRIVSYLIHLQNNITS